jgi:hypothetical protein
VSEYSNYKPGTPHSQIPEKKNGYDIRSLLQV